MVLAIIAAMMWGIAAALVPLLAGRRHVLALWALVATGVPVLGALTYILGPAVGVGALVTGLLILLFSPVAYVRNLMGYGRGQSLTE